MHPQCSDVDIIFAVLAHNNLVNVSFRQYKTFGAYRFKTLLDDSLHDTVKKWGHVAQSSKTHAFLNQFLCFLGVAQWFKQGRGK